MSTMFRIMLIFSIFANIGDGQILEPHNGRIVILPSTNITARLGDEITLRCIYIGNRGEQPYLSFWAKYEEDGDVSDPIVHKGGNVTSDHRFIPVSNSDVDVDLVIKADREDVGKYTCRVGAYADIYLRRDIVFEREATLHIISVNFLESPIVEPKMMFVSNKTAEFTCSVPNGYPTPITHHWIKDGRMLDISDSDKYLHFNTTLKIKEVNKSDEGEYQCRAADGMETQTKMSNIAKLVVLTPSILSDVSTTIDSITRIDDLRCDSPGVLLLLMIFTGFLVGIISSVIVGLFFVYKKPCHSKKPVPTETQKPKAQMYATYDASTQQNAYDDVINPVDTAVYENVNKKNDKW